MLRGTDPHPPDVVRRDNRRRSRASEAKIAEFAHLPTVAGPVRKSLAAAVLAGVCLGVPARGATRIPPGEAPRADASVRTALERGDAELDVIAGVRDGIPYGRALSTLKDGKEPERRTKRLEAQDRIAREVGPELRLRR